MTSRATELRLVAEKHSEVNIDEAVWANVNKSMLKFAEAGYYKVVFFEDYEINSILQHLPMLESLGYKVDIIPDITTKIDSISISW